jgi:hypothetical protein
MRRRIVAVCIAALAGGLAGPRLVFAQQDCSTPSDRLSGGTDETCTGGNSNETTTHTRKYQGKVDTACNDNGWRTTTAGWSSEFSVAGNGMCGPVDPNAAPQCVPAFSMAAPAYETAGDWTFTATARNNTYTGSGCALTDSQSTFQTVFGETCTDTFCCGLQSDCRSAQGEFNTTTCQCTLQPTPIVVDVAGNGFNLTDAAGGVLFDIAAEGRRQLVSWTQADSDDAFLVLDRTGNGLIDDAAELFGNFTDQMSSESPNGFEALRVFDSNGDGSISAEDPVFSTLQLWTDRNHNGVSETDELVPLGGAGVTRLWLNYRESRRQDENGNVFRYRAAVDGVRPRFAYDVYLVIASTTTAPKR